MNIKKNNNNNNTIFIKKQVNNRYQNAELNSNATRCTVFYI